MVVVMAAEAGEAEVDGVVELVRGAGSDAFVSRGVSRTIVGLVGDIDQLDTLNLRGMPGVSDVVRITAGMLRKFSVSSWSMSPTRPTIVRDTPRLTNASPPAPRTSSTTPSTSASPASVAITTTMSPASSRSHAEDQSRSYAKKSPGPLARGSR